MNRKILIVDDEKNHRLMLKIHLEEAGYDVEEAENGFEALNIIENERVRENSFFAMLLDIKMSVMDGLTVLSKLKEKKVKLPVIMVTAFNNVRTAVETMKLGAVDFITKPVDIKLLLKIIDNISNTATLEPKIEEDDEFIFDGVYTKESFGELIELLKMVAPTDASVLISGESGTGKELVAKAIHKNSKRGDKAFLAINCAALNENLIESELFGHEKGAFTGATALKRGKFEVADKGTVFLDEIGELPLATQAKLLRVLQEKEFERVGGTKTIKSDVRIIAATNRDLQEMVKNGSFREDLYFRLNVFPIKLPPLRKRKADLPLLVDFFIQKYANSFGKIVKGYTDEFIEKLLEYNFYGNVRELENIVSRAIILSKTEILTPDLIPELKNDQEIKDDAPLDIKENEKNLIIKALNETGGNKSQAAKILGISRKTLHNKIKEYNIE
jgi:two-component system response regulator HydG